ncbi:MAG: GGDEF domain-containing protein [Lachnospiraceae bacterium]|nr:GGDEF domain-containing protein [Lachnospiraceae bacterium]
MEENKKEFGKDQVEQIIKMFGERRMNRFGCDDYYTLCGYRKSDGALCHYDGALLSLRNLDMPEKIEDMSKLVAIWPIEPQLLASAKTYFSHLSKGKLDSVMDLSNLDLLLTGDEDCWINVSSIETSIDGEEMVEVLFINEDGEKILLKKAIYGSELDDLTGTLNRNAVMRALAQMTENGGQHTYILLDIDTFKEVNLTFGYKMGDQVLVNVVNILRKHLRTDDVLGRIGDDEFFICLYNVHDREVVERIAAGIVKNTRISLPGGLSITSSVGVVMSPEDGDCAPEIYGHADLAMLSARKKGGDTYSFYEPEEQPAVQ